MHALMSDRPACAQACTCSWPPCARCVWEAELSIRAAWAHGSAQAAVPMCEAQVLHTVDELIPECR